MKVKLETTRRKQKKYRNLRTIILQQRAQKTQMALNIDGRGIPFSFFFFFYSFFLMRNERYLVIEE
jgi:hypothetical protein